jgi:hypothetical protein
VGHGAAGDLVYLQLGTDHVPSLRPALKAGTRSRLGHGTKGMKLITTSHKAVRAWYCGGYLKSCELVSKTGYTPQSTSHIKPAKPCRLALDIKDNHNHRYWMCNSGSEKLPEVEDTNVFIE